jgi:hypothetical protein
MSGNFGVLPALFLYRLKDLLKLSLPRHWLRIVLYGELLRELEVGLD